MKSMRFHRHARISPIRSPVMIASKTMVRVGSVPAATRRLTSTGTLYVVAATKEGPTSYVYRLHALSVTTGQEKFGGPVPPIQAASGSVTLLPKQHLQRPGLLLVNGVVYIGFGSHGDMSPWYGWLLAGVYKI